MHEFFTIQEETLTELLEVLSRRNEAEGWYNRQPQVTIITTSTGEFEALVRLERTRQHECHEDCLICIECGKCREDLDSDDLCPDCGGVDENDPVSSETRL